LNNIADALTARALEEPARIAMHFPIAHTRIGQVWQIRYLDITFGELNRRSDAIARGLRASGLEKGQRAVVMVRPSPEFFLVMFALFKIGAVPVLVDPGIAKSALKQCLDHAAPHAFIGISLAHAARVILGWGKASIVKNITIGRRWFWGGEILSDIENLGANSTIELPKVQANDLAAILFTSGSTGVPKGVSYLHRHFVAQVELLREAFQIKPGTVNLPTFPPFALFDPALGCTSVIPIMDPTRPAQADPRKLISAIRQFSIQSMFGSPALLRTLSSYCQQHQVKLPTLKTVMSAGAPVPPDLLEMARAMLGAEARIFTPYGATEALPVAIASDDILLGEVRAKVDAGAGICVGVPMAANLVRIIAINDAAIGQFSDAAPVPANTVGEITVTGPSVTEEYFLAPEKTQLAKMQDHDRIVHRMGDVGFLDDLGQLWYCGRKSHRVQTETITLFTEQVEAIFNERAPIQRCALVGVGSAPRQTPVIVIELRRDGSKHRTPALLETLARVANEFDITRSIRHFLIYPKPFPVDIRHNAKINREALARFACQRLPIERKD
jgi:olefin beta-lactone synthetase